MISVIVPTRSRPHRLRATVHALSSQHPPPGGFELVVVDDSAGGVDEVERVLDGLALPLVVVESGESGPAAARNAGVAAASGDLLLFLGDDTVPRDPDLLARHVALHSNGDRMCAVLGRVERVAASRFERWVDASGIQFAYGRLDAGEVDPARFFYSSHVSLGRETLECAGGFDERFVFAAVEDVELGTRLGRAGVRLEYHPELVVNHHHPTSLDESLARVERVGREAALYRAIHPEAPHPDLRPPTGLRWRLVRRVAPVVRRAARLPIVSRLAWRLLHLAAYSRGYEAATRSGATEAV